MNETDSCGGGGNTETDNPLYHTRLRAQVSEFVPQFSYILFACQVSQRLFQDCDSLTLAAGANV